MLLEKPCPISSAGWIFLGKHWPYITDAFSRIHLIWLTLKSPSGFPFQLGSLQEFTGST